MKRREFMALLGGAAVWPFPARAQRDDRVRRVGVLISNAADDPETKARYQTFTQGLAQSGWIEGRNLRIDTRLSAGAAETRRTRPSLSRWPRT